MYILNPSCPKLHEIGYCTTSTFDKIIAPTISTIFLYTGTTFLICYDAKNSKMEEQARFSNKTHLYSLI